MTINFGTDAKNAILLLCHTGHLVNISNCSANSGLNVPGYQCEGADGSFFYNLFLPVNVDSHPLLAHSYQPDLSYGWFWQHGQKCGVCTTWNLCQDLCPAVPVPIIFGKKPRWGWWHMTYLCSLIIYINMVLQIIKCVLGMHHEWCNVKMNTCQMTEKLQEDILIIWPQSFNIWGKVLLKPC